MTVYRLQMNVFYDKKKKNEIVISELESEKNTQDCA